LVSAELKDLYRRAAAAGQGQQVLDALKKAERVLRIYPQFGDPFRDLTTPGETVYAASFPPLYVEYIIDEPNRAVFIVVPFKAMPNVGFE
jgi:hypothetical protein